MAMSSGSQLVVFVTASDGISLSFESAHRQPLHSAKDRSSDLFVDGLLTFCHLISSFVVDTDRRMRTSLALVASERTRSPFC